VPGDPLRSFGAQGLLGDGREGGVDEGDAPPASLEPSASPGRGGAPRSRSAGRSSRRGEAGRSTEGVGALNVGRGESSRGGAPLPQGGPGTRGRATGVSPPPSSSPRPPAFRPTTWKTQVWAQQRGALAGEGRPPPKALPENASPLSLSSTLSRKIGKLRRSGSEDLPGAPRPRPLP
jgi:hypothetical protein